MKSSVHLQIEQLHLEPGQECTDESPAWRFLRMTKGDAYWLEASKPRVLTVGELLVAAPKIKVNIRASQLGEVVLDGFLFYPSLLCGLLTMAERRMLESDANLAQEPVQFLPSTHPISQGLATLTERGQTVHELVERGEVLVLALRLLSQAMPIVDQPVERRAPAEDRFQEIISQMPDMELIQHSAEELAQLCGCTPRHFTRLFRQQFGESPRARQTQLRLLKARALLESSEVKVSQIASDCGYHSLSLFNSLFKRRFGITPSEWRQNMIRKSAHFPALVCVLTLVWGMASGTNMTPANPYALGHSILIFRSAN